MKRLRYLFILSALVACVFATPRTGFAQASTKVSSPTTTTTTTNAAAPADVARIINSFSSKETEFRTALNNYAFTRDVVVQTIGMGGQVTGEFRRTSTFSFDDKGNRSEKITFAPAPTLTEIVMSQSDLDDLGGIQPYALEASKINDYSFTYVGKERIDELDLYVFDVGPKVKPDPKKTKERFFQGRIWVDDRDMQIVKVRGKGIPETKEAKYPVFETYREQIDGRYWFPTYTYADDELDFGKGQTVHVRMSVRYTDYKKFGSKVIIKEVDPDEKEPN